MSASARRSGSVWSSCLARYRTRPPARASRMRLRPPRARRIWAAWLSPLTCWFLKEELGRRRPLFGHFDGLALGLAANQGFQRSLIFVLEPRWIEMALLGLEDVLGQLDHVARQPR